jgi:hypothetical protein
LEGDLTEKANEQTLRSLYVSGKERMLLSRDGDPMARTTFPPTVYMSDKTKQLIIHRKEKSPLVLTLKGTTKWNKRCSSKLWIGVT